MLSLDAWLWGACRDRSRLGKGMHIASMEKTEPLTHSGRFPAWIISLERRQGHGRRRWRGRLASTRPQPA